MTWKLLLGRIFNRWDGFKDSCKEEFLKSLILHCGKEVRILQGCIFKGKKNISIGDYTWVGNNCYFLAGAPIQIGNWCQIANNVIIVTVNHNINGEKYFDNTNNRPIVIGNNVWIGANAIILPGVSIGDNSVVAAGSIVTKDIPACQLFGGNPARPLKDISSFFSKNQ